MAADVPRICAEPYADQDIGLSVLPAPAFHGFRLLEILTILLIPQWVLFPASVSGKVSGTQRGPKEDPKRRKCIVLKQQKSSVSENRPVVNWRWYDNFLCLKP